ncbi:DUF1601 domain-containing protein [Endozoicomonas sp. GU-1]|uniref:DUF1601 domain-containing protein n=1 Tax=Endozoicomonas sp. GU-1 TaxID=3009078 RepID=UPI0022B31B49|nr:DUF1601 domain-containing protein [Endozoicomonas sp. GU-1]WBA82147.1 DUF1601 domain-containing protein [Endozoicomonas sp. GU-1]
MDKGGAGISWACTTSGNDYHQPDEHTGASGSGRYRHGTVRWTNTPLPYIPKRHVFYRASDACSANHPPRHAIKPVQDFNALITQERMDYLVRISAHYGDRYDGKKHCQFACSIKQYTLRSKRPLNQTEQHQLITLLHDFKATSGWPWRSLTTTLHAFTSAGVFTPHKYMNERGKEAQAAFLSTLLDAVILKCNQEPDAMGIDTQGTANLLWALAKMVSNGLELETTPKLKEAVAALLPLVKTKAESIEEKDHFNPQEITNLLWAVAKLLDNGLVLEKIPKLKETVVALLSHVKTKAKSQEGNDHFNTQGTANLLWAVAKMVDNGLDKTPKLNEAVAALLLLVKTKAESKEEKDHFKPQEVANLLWAMAKLVDNGLDKTPKLNEAVAALLPLVKTKAESKEERDHVNPQVTANQLWATAKLVDNGLGKTPQLKEAVAALLPLVKTKAESKEEKDHFTSQEVANLLWAMAKLVDNGLALEKTAKLKEAVAALLPHVKTRKSKGYFKPQEVANLLWALAKLVDNGLEFERTPRLKEAVAALFPRVKTKAESKEERDQFNPQETVNLMWAVAKLVDNGLELETTLELKETVDILLSCVKTRAELKQEKIHFIPQHINNLLWAVAKLVDNGLELEKTAKLKETVAALLPHVKTMAESTQEKDRFIPQHIANLLWALAKLVENGLELEKAPTLKEAVNTLLPLVKTMVESKEARDHFKPQEVANLLWALAKLVDNGLELEKTPKLKEAVAALLLRVKTRVESKEEKDYFNTQAIANMLWAVVKLLEHGLELEKALKLTEAAAVLLPNLKTKAESTEEKGQFIPQHIANLVWAVAKLVDNGLALETTPMLKEAMAALLPHVKTKTESTEEKDHFKPQEVTNLVWALAKLVDNGLELEKVAKLKEAVVALLPHVKTKAQSKEEKDHFIPQHIANLLWAVAKLGEAIELKLVKSTFNSLACRLSENPQFSQSNISVSLWGVMVFCARYYLYFGDDNKNALEKYIDKLFSRLESLPPSNTEFSCIAAMAASWLGRACSVAPHYETTTSQSQSNLRDQLQSSFPSLQIEEEKSLNSLPPVDLLLPDYNMVIDVQGPSHYVCGDFKTRNGSTLLKVALLKKLGFEVIEIPVNKINNQDSMKRVIEQIKIKLAVSPESHGLVLRSSGEEAADEAYFTADEGWQLSDDCYFTAEEYLEEQINKPKKRKRKRKKPVKTSTFMKYPG